MRTTSLEERKVAHALRRSRYTDKILVALLEHGELSLDVLARECRFRTARVWALLHGEPPEYSRRTSPIHLKLVLTRRRASGTMVRLSARGRSVARGVARGRVI